MTPEQIQTLSNLISALSDGSLVATLQAVLTIAQNGIMNDQDAISAGIASGIVAALAPIQAAITAATPSAQPQEVNA